MLDTLENQPFSLGIRMIPKSVVEILPREGHPWMSRKKQDDSVFFFVQQDRGSPKKYNAFS